MKVKPKRTKTNWRSLGKAPDYRFSLANERTYLAWMRTAMALLAGAVAIDQLTPELANPIVRLILSAFLCLCSGLLALFAYKRWAGNEKAMRHNRELHYTSFLKVISGVAITLTFIISIAILL